MGPKVPSGFEQNVLVDPTQMKALVQAGVTSFPWETLELLTWEETTVKFLDAHRPVGRALVFAT